MPHYEYECAKCHKGFEIFQSMKDDALKVCPKNRCRQKKWGKGRVKRKIGAGAGFIFKGSGFYITDYRSEGYKSGAKSDSAGAGSGASSDSSSSTKTDSVKSDSKPAAKSDSKPVAKPAPKTGA
ncbi:MAG: zinc ribbon domain-containing protein [Methylacidiphilales bacterium]|nr:zinc ribbon domain-containing protein [Candidatus Methylacidiphilales bacterium]